VTGDEVAGEVAVYYDALAGAASRVRELMAFVSRAPLPRADATAVGHARLAGALEDFSDRWDAVVATAHDQGVLLATRLVDAVEQYTATDASIAAAAHSLGATRRGAT
jgi:hypothetical protein